MSWDDATTAALPDRWVTRLHLFRHGRVETGDQRVCRGHVDVPLSERGLAQSRAVAEFCGTLGPVDGVLCSDLSRASVMGHLVGERLGVPVIEAPDLREQHMGDWEGRPWSELQQEQGDAINAYWDDYLDARPPNGESYADMVQRVDAFLDAWLPLALDETWVFCTHIGVVRWMLCKTLGMRPDEALRFAPGYASYSRLLWADAGGVVEVVGQPVP